MRISVIGNALLALPAALIVSCQKHNDFSTGECGCNPIALLPTTSLLTKSPVSGTSFPENRTIILSAWFNGLAAPSSNYFEGIEFFRDGEMWATSGKYWPQEGTLDFLAYSADGLSVSATYDDNVSDGVTLAVPDNSIAQADILWASASSQRYAPAGNPLVFRHAQAALAFTATSNVAYDATVNVGITIERIIVRDVGCSGMVRLDSDMTCAWSDIADVKDLSLCGLESGYGVPDTAVDLSVFPFGIGGTGIIVPVQTGTSFTVVYTAHNGRDNDGNPLNRAGLVFDYDCSGDSWTAGRKQVYALSFDMDAVIVTPGIYDWETDDAEVAVEEKFSAVYNVSGVHEINLPVTFSEGSSAGIDWGDGMGETFQLTSERRITLNHSYLSPFTGEVKMTVHSGLMDFGAVPARVFYNFNINDEDAVLMTKRVFAPTALPGKFFVNDALDYVEFAGANLYWDGYEFLTEEKQYACPEAWDSDHVGHFFWSKDARVAYAEDYASANTAYGIAPAKTDSFFAADGGLFEGWTVLSKEEWKYVWEHYAVMELSERSVVTIDGVPCGIIVPEGYSGTVAESFTAEEWSAAEAEYGFVAFPCAGLRRGTEISDLLINAFIATSTPYSSAGSMCWRATIGKNNKPSTSSNMRGLGYSVRLVRKHTAM